MITLIVVSIWAALIIVLLCWSAFWRGYRLGIKVGIEKQPKRDMAAVVRGKDLHVTIDWPAVENILDHRGLIAVPKGADFQLRKRA